MAAQFITVEFFITQYVSQIGGRGVRLFYSPGTVKIGPWAIQSEMEIYYLMVTLVILCTLAMSNLLRSKIGRAWVAIRDNDIAAEALGVNIVLYKLLAFFVRRFLWRDCRCLLGDLPRCGQPGTLSVWLVPLAGRRDPHRRGGEHPWNDLRRDVYDADPGRVKVSYIRLTQNPFFVNLMPFLPHLP